MSATIERRKRGNAWTLSAPGQPTVVSIEKVVLPCGCCAYSGIRIDTQEVSMVSIECSPEHQPVRDRFHELMVESLKNPTKQLLIEVAKELLEQANSEREAGLL